MLIGPKNSPYRLKPLDSQLDISNLDQVFHGTHLLTGFEFAVKLEKLNVTKPYLLYEGYLQQMFQGYKGFVDVHEITSYNGYNVMISDLLGPNL